MNDEQKKEIIDLLSHDNPDVSELIALVDVHHGNPIEKRTFFASPHRNIGKMRWALAKAIGLSLGEFHSGNFAKKVIPTTPAGSAADYPPVIDRIKKELEALMSQRTELQKELVELGDGNEEETMAKAAHLGDVIDELAARHQLLHDAKELYFNEQVVPDEAELFGEPQQKVITVLEGGNLIEIMKRRDNLISSLSKDRNMLVYQNKSAKDKEENPMPAGPEREKVEARIIEKEEELEAINEYLENHKGE